MWGQAAVFAMYQAVWKAVSGHFRSSPRKRGPSILNRNLLDSRFRGKERRAQSGRSRVQAGKKIRLDLFPRLHGADDPLAVVDAAGFALHPGFVLVVDIACEEIPAGEAILREGRRDRR